MVATCNSEFSNGSTPPPSNRSSVCKGAASVKYAGVFLCPVNENVLVSNSSRGEMLEPNCAGVFLCPENENLLTSNFSRGEMLEPNCAKVLDPGIAGKAGSVQEGNIYGPRTVTDESDSRHVLMMYPWQAQQTRKKSLPTAKRVPRLGKSVAPDADVEKYQSHRMPRSCSGMLEA